MPDFQKRRGCICCKSYHFLISRQSRLEVISRRSCKPRSIQHKDTGNKGCIDVIKPFGPCAKMPGLARIWARLISGLLEKTCIRGSPLESYITVPTAAAQPGTSWPWAVGLAHILRHCLAAPCGKPSPAPALSACLQLTAQVTAPATPECLGTATARVLDQQPSTGGPDLIPRLLPSPCSRADREGECWPLSLTPTPLLPLAPPHKRLRVHAVAVARTCPCSENGTFG